MWYYGIMVLWYYGMVLWVVHLEGYLIDRILVLIGSTMVI